MGWEMMPRTGLLHGLSIHNTNINECNWACERDLQGWESFWCPEGFCAMKNTLVKAFAWGKLCFYAYRAVGIVFLSVWELFWAHFLFWCFLDPNLCVLKTSMRFMMLTVAADMAFSKSCPKQQRTSWSMCHCCKLWFLCSVSGQPFLIIFGMFFLLPT